MATLASVDAFPPHFQGRSEDDVRTRRRWFALRRGEPAAAVPLEGPGQWLSMVRDGICRLTGVSDFPVLCREGTLWITSPEDPGDTVVAAGEQLSVTSLGTILVVALAPSSMWVPRGFAVDDAEGSSKRRMSRIFPVSTDAADAPRPFLHRAFHRVVAARAVQLDRHSRRARTPSLAIGRSCRLREPHPYMGRARGTPAMPFVSAVIMKSTEY